MTKNLHLSSAIRGTTTAMYVSIGGAAVMLLSPNSAKAQATYYLEPIQNSPVNWTYNFNSSYNWYNINNGSRFSFPGTVSGDSATIKDLNQSGQYQATNGTYEVDLPNEGFSLGDLEFLSDDSASSTISYNLEPTLNSAGYINFQQPAGDNNGATLVFGTANGNADAGSHIINVPLELTASLTLTDDTALTIQSVISGQGSLLIAGGGTVSLANAGNSYGGGTNIGSATAQVTQDGDLGNSADGLSFASGTLQISAPTSGLDFSSGRSIFLGGKGGTAGTFSVDSNVTALLSGAISGNGSAGIAKTGPGTLFLTNNNSNYSGTTTVSAGILAISSITTSTSSNPDPLGSGSVTLAGGTLSLQGSTLTGAQHTVALTNFNANVIVPAGTSAANVKNVVTTFDGSYAFYEVGYVPAPDSTGLPVNRTITSTTGDRATFTLQPYTGNNVLLVSGGETGYTSLVTPEKFSTINILAAAANVGSAGAATSVDLYFSDGTQDSFTATVPDWFTTGGAFGTGGRVTVSNGAVQEPGSGFPQLYEIDQTLSPVDAAKVVTGMAFYNGSGSTTDLGIFAVSGNIGAPNLTQVYSNPVTITADSTISVVSSQVANFPSLAIGANTLSVSGVSNGFLSFDGTELNGNATFDVTSSEQLYLGPVSGTGGFSKVGSGTVVLTSTGSYGGSTSISGGTLLVEATGAFPDATALNISAVGIVKLSPSISPVLLRGLIVQGQGQFDVANNTVNDYYGGISTPFNAIVGDIVSGYANGQWNGVGIISSSLDGHHGVGYTDNGASVIFGYALLGDTNMDGSINFNDLLTLAQHYGQSGQNWDTGDTNYDGSINFTDLLNLAQNYGQSIGGAEAGNFSPAFASEWNLAVSEMQAVPEPASAGLLLAATGTALMRRRGRKIFK